jgi:hypothetical protein
VLYGLHKVAAGAECVVDLRSWVRSEVSGLTSV